MILQDIITHSIDIDEAFTYFRCHVHSSIVNQLYIVNLSGKETENAEIESIRV
jgi:hypothetical protein